MAIKTTLEQLEEVQAAISEVLTSQEFARSDKRVVRARLDALHKREQDLLDRYNREQGGGRAKTIGIIRRD